MRALAMLACLASLSVSGCGDVGPEIGDEFDAGADAGSTACALADSDPVKAVRWDDVKATIFVKRCGCHMTPSGFGATVGGLLLASHDTALKGGRHNKDGVLAISPGAPCGSYIVHKTGSAPPFGARMPLSSIALPQAERQLLIDWIAEGALK